MPELPSKTRIGRLLYGSRIERAGRREGHLIVTEIKTGSYVLAPDHLLQVWGYCLVAPGAVLRATDRNFRARAVQWSLEYSNRDKSYGPCPFTDRTLRSVRDAMKLHELVYLAGRASDKDLTPDLYGPSPKKCPPCAFFHACTWSYQDPFQATLEEPETGI